MPDIDDYFENRRMEAADRFWGEEQEDLYLIAEAMEREATTFIHCMRNHKSCLKELGVDNLMDNLLQALDNFKHDEIDPAISVIRGKIGDM